jgi:hypothetical protein
MKKYTLYIGLNDMETKTQEIETSEARKIIEDIFYNKIGGATIYLARGVYAHNNGEKVLENTVIVECFDAEKDDIVYISEYLKKVLNQESIALNIQEIEAQFI